MTETLAYELRDVGYPKIANDFGWFLVDLKRVTFRYWPEGALYFRARDELWFCNVAPARTDTKRARTRSA
jgi:hypothetical protein